MSEYYLAIKVIAIPIYRLNDWDDVINYPWHVYPKSPLNLYSTFKPEGDYEVAEYFSSPVRALSKRVIESAGLRHIYGVNFVEGMLHDRNQNYDFYLMNLTSNKIQCMDKSASVYDWDDEYKEVDAIKKLVLDYDVLDKIPLNKRLIFEMEEDNITLYHKSIVERIMATNPLGLDFVTPDKFRFGMN